MTKAEKLSQLYHNIREALRQWRKASDTESPLADITVIQRAQDEGYTIKQATNKVLLEELKRLEEKNAEGAQVLRWRFLDGEAVHTVAYRLNIAVATVYIIQRVAIEHLAQSLLKREEEIEEEWSAELLGRLEVPNYTELIGLEEAKNRLMEVVLSETAPWLISLEGYGGIGKTTLADALARQVIEDHSFDDLAWVSARLDRFSIFGEILRIEQPALSSEALIEKLALQLMGNLFTSTCFSLTRATKALQVRLKEHPHLIIIDNLETVLDVEALLPTLHSFAAPTKILFTTRKSLFAVPGVYRYVAQELSEANALHLVREGARLGNLMELADASDEDLRPIYQTVGGNPLALRLIVGQTHVHSLDLILRNFVQRRGRTVQDLYTYIYRQAWDSLDEVTRRLFLAMPLIPATGGDFQHLQVTSGLTIADATYALKQLVNRNLVDVRGDFLKRRYTIHNLTRTFLQEDIAQWGMGVVEQ